jgi:hypothetical protein
MEPDLEKNASQLNALNPPSQQASQSQNCEFGWQNISFSVDTPVGKKQILNGVNGCVEKGILTSVRH